MTPSAEVQSSSNGQGRGAAPLDQLPPALSSMWRVLKLGYHAEPSLLLLAFGMSLFSALPDALFALWLKLLADGVAASNQGLVLAAAIGLALSAAGTWFLEVISDRMTRRFRDRVTVALESHVARLQASVATIEHHERPEYLDRLAMLRQQVFVLDHMYMSLFSTCGWLLRLVVTLGLLVSVDPLLGFLLLFALPTVLTSGWRPAVERAANERGEQYRRLARHLFVLATSAPPGKEVRVTGIGESLLERMRGAYDRWYGPVAAARTTSAWFHAAAWLLFGLAYVGAVVWITRRADSDPGAVLLVLAAGARLSAYVGATVGEIGFLRGIWLDGSKRLAWLEDYAAALVDHADAAVPSQLKQGIALDQVSFCYPGSDRKVLDEVSLQLPAGAVVALVGENGAGKSTLVKLLCKLYEPTSGQILIDGVSLARMPAPAWRSKLAGAFQDFFRFELPARQSVGLGDLARLDDGPAVERAIERAGARDVVERLERGLDTQLGPTWPGGVELSFGQWQKLALARGFMRDEPLLLVLDEPTAALDAETEHALFERFAAAARTQRAAGGGITILVSHRFSTVRMADLIVVLDGARVAEIGSHETLITRGGPYAELYGIQAAAYR
ncbi:MAG TPA: ABC transporter ATP-binding protein [Polyangiales bacterium]|nr:ABC transporter ATP-binding protein [Polyangiales bacterium]